MASDTKPIPDGIDRTSREYRDVFREEGQRACTAYHRGQSNLRHPPYDGRNIEGREWRTGWMEAAHWYDAGLRNMDLWHIAKDVAEAIAPNRPGMHEDLRHAAYRLLKRLHDITNAAAASAGLD